MLYLPSYSSCNWEFAPFNHLYPVPPVLSTSPLSGNHQSILCFYKFHFLKYYIYEIMQDLSFSV